MAWYKKYLTVYGKSLTDIPENTLSEIREKVKENVNYDKPLISLVVIAHNEAIRALSCLWSLIENKSKYPFEIIGIDNNSTDNTSSVFEAIGITYYKELNLGQGHARQCGLEHANGKYYFCIDSDTLYPPHYIETMLENLEEEGVSATTSLWSFIPDEKHKAYALFVYELLRDIHIRIQARKRPERSARGASLCFETALARQVGFRTNIYRGEDGAMSFAMKKHGRIKLVTSRKARFVTSTNSLSKDGSLFHNFRMKTLSIIKNLSIYFIENKELVDTESNIRKK